jgi:hypothetical protein
MGGTISEGMLMSRSVRIRPMGGIGVWERRSEAAERDGLEAALVLR